MLQKRQNDDKSGKSVKGWKPEVKLFKPLIPQRIPGAEEFGGR